MESRELAQLRAERQQLLAALGRHVSDRPWPVVDDVVNIGARWDGPALFGQDSCLVLEEGDDVRVEHKSPQGWLWGIVDATGESGWFGGRGCVATVHISASVPLGPSNYSSVPPKTPFGAENEGADAAGGAGDLDLQAEVEAYIEKYGIDAAAQEALQELSPEDQRRVIDADLVNCRNPSAVLLSRVRACRQGRSSALSGGGDGVGGVGGLGASPLGQRPRSRSPLRGATPVEVEEFVTRHQIDEAARAVLDELPPLILKEVLQTDLRNCRNPSAVLMSRIRALEQGRNPTLPSQSQQPAPGGRGSGGCYQGTFGAQLTNSFPQQQPAFSPPPLSTYAPSLQVASQHSPDSKQAMSALVEEFIARHSLDEAAAARLRELPPTAQGHVIEVELVNCKNPSAVVCSRIQNYRAGGSINPATAAQSALSQPMRILDPVEDYVRRFNLDDKVAHELRLLSPEVQQTVIETDLVNARNPSAVVSSRIREVKARAAGMPRDGYLR